MGTFGALFVSAIADIPPSDGSDSPVPRVWLGLAIPVLAVALNVALQVAPGDFIVAFLITLIAYLTTFGASYLVKDNVGTFLAATVTTLCANACSWYFDKPQTIYIQPAVILLVSGSIGFRGIVNLARGEAFLGAQQFGEMLLVALVITVGLLAGNSLIRPPTTL